MSVIQRKYLFQRKKDCSNIKRLELNTLFPLAYIAEFNVIYTILLFAITRLGIYIFFLHKYDLSLIMIIF